MEKFKDFYKAVNEISQEGTQRMLLRQEEQKIVKIVVADDIENKLYLKKLFQHSLQDLLEKNKQAYLKQYRKYNFTTRETSHEKRKL